MIKKKNLLLCVLFTTWLLWNLTNIRKKMGITVNHSRTALMCLAVSWGSGWWSRCWPCQNYTQGTFRQAGGVAESPRLPPHRPFYFFSFAFISLYVLLSFCCPTTSPLNTLFCFPYRSSAPLTNLWWRNEPRANLLFLRIKLTLLCRVALNYSA